MALQCPIRRFAFLTIMVAASFAGIQSSVAGYDTPTPPGLAYLRDEPVTLLDLGFLRLHRDLERAAAPLADPDYDDVPPRTGVFYNWRQDRIHAFATFPTPPERRTAALCIERFMAMTASLLGGAPDGPDQVRGYLIGLFSHVGPRRWHGAAPRSFGGDLEAAFRFSVTLTGDRLDQRVGDFYTVKCSGRLDATAASLTVRESGV